MVEQSAVNRSVVGSNPTCGAIYLESCPSWPKEHDWKSCRRINPSQGFKSLALRHYYYTWPVGQAVKTPPFHGGNTGSNPVGVIFSLDQRSARSGGLAQLGEHLPYKQGVAGSSPASSTILIFQSYRGVEQRTK